MTSRIASRLPLLAAGGLSLLLIGGHASASNRLAEKYGCLGCHATAAKLVGPSYTDVAAKYKGDAEAIAKLAQSIRGGGSGRWGEVPMPPQSQVSEADAKKLATWILGGGK